MHHCLNHDWTTYDYNNFEKAYPDLRKMVDTFHELRADGTDSSQQAQFSFCDQSLLLTCSAILIGQVDGTAPDMPRVGNLVSPGVIIQPKQEISPYEDVKATSQALIHTLFANPMWGDSEDSALFHIPWISADYYNTPQHDQDFNIDDSWAENVEQMSRNGWDFLLLYGNFLSFEYFRRRLGRFRIGGKRFQDYFVQSIGQCRLPEDRVRLDVAKLVGAYLARRLITLSTGHFGLAPNTIQPNNQIYVVLGCSVPVVLRPKPDTGHFEVVGECYVEGYAKGEARKAVDEGKFSIQKITLC
ncbi:hypothetical protein K469DRAFT_685478 [Zopfia rhizophila CBS 207.26]|uniref:Heterokaryon incompatibility domain-containing protein n=1 Tax=Zopfia rhizophila CBS 207.26 TaxID=1314779 RepID=A0A6A6EAL0_9PEZI|nr:hypothetical protein K469DRAFT_685478 [Zopfia rhizophila CBS 207.26]